MRLINTLSSALNTHFKGSLYVCPQLLLFALIPKPLLSNFLLIPDTVTVFVLFYFGHGGWRRVGGMMSREDGVEGHEGNVN
jgi:hypothetical protein